MDYKITKSRVLDFMMSKCRGYRNAKHLQAILELLPFPISERQLRSIFSELKHENHIASTHTRGYWGVPLVMTGPNDPDEIAACHESVAEMKSRAMDMLKDTSKQETMLNEMSRNIKEKQLDFIGA